jgi:hypothetical protein
MRSEPQDDGTPRRRDRVDETGDLTRVDLLGRELKVVDVAVQRRVHRRIGDVRVIREPGGQERVPQSGLQVRPAGEAQTLRTARHRRHVHTCPLGDLAGARVRRERRLHLQHLVDAQQLRAQTAGGR